MKIAICLSGQPRSFVQGYQYLKRNVLDVNPRCDIYIHTWKNSYYTDAAIKKIYKPVKMYSDHNIFDPKYINEYYINTPNPQKYPPYFTLSALFSVLESSKIMQESGIEYDWVVKTRFDYAINRKIPFDRLEKGKLYIPNCRMVPTRDFGNDQFAFGDMNVMIEYMSTYAYLDEYYSAGTAMIGEDMLSANLKRHNLVGDNLVYVDMNNPFPPGPHNGTPHSLIRDDYELWAN